MSLSQILLIPGVGQMTFRDALSLLAPYSPRLSYNFIEPANSLFQGTTLTPVTAVTNPIRVVIDQTQGGLTNLGAELLTNGDFSNGFTNWSSEFAAGFSEVGGKASITNASTNIGLMQTGLTLNLNKTYLIEYDLNITSGGILNIRFGGDASSSNIPSASASTSGRKRIVAKPLVSTDRILLQVSTGSTLTIDNVSVREIPGYHATASSDAKRPLWNEFSVNGRTVRGAVFDGSDDCLQVSGFDLSNTDEVCVIAGVRKLSDAARGVICELTATIASNNGAFNLTAPNAASDTFAFESKGTTLRDAVATGSTAPISRHLTGIGDISGDLSRLIVNATSTSNTSDQGTGNYSSSTLNIGGRNNAASLPFNGALSYLFVLGSIPPDDVLTRIYRGLAPQIGVSV